MVCLKGRCGECPTHIIILQASNGRPAEPSGKASHHLINLQGGLSRLDDMYSMQQGVEWLVGGIDEERRPRTFQ